MTPLRIATLIYLAIINITGFITAFSDKRKARRGAWRIPEKAFLWLSVFGGGLGVLAGFFAFRHKTRHVGLMLGVISITAVFYAAAVYIAIITAQFP
jgi:uncharacterized membrane protein YsdA (DUF1294 family)